MRPGVAFLFSVISGAISIFGGIPSRAIASERSLTDAQIAGQHVIFPFNGSTPPSWLVHRIRRGEAAGVLLFAGNGTSAVTVRRLTDRLQAISRPPAVDAPLLIMVDQEGGPVRRLDGPPALGAGRLAARPVLDSLRAGRSAGALLCRTGVNVNLAPVLDLSRPGSVIAAQGRSFGPSPRSVARRGLQFAVGQGEWGVLSVPKHFPGLGAASATTDDTPVTIGLSAATLRVSDEWPYRPLIRRGLPMIMVGTAIYSSLGSRPAALDAGIVQGELRERLGFRGVAISDALDTPALAPWGTHERVAAAATRAGIDLLLYAGPGAARSAVRGVRRAIGRNVVLHDRAAASVDRTLSMRRSMATAIVGPLPALSPRPLGRRGRPCSPG
ncbi:MAG: beta-N-acetylhexosaminidase [Thermoleophilia bacterium]|nr:beta-N-acetylhexosaminidase [Thermoleophilia bacterium]